MAESTNQSVLARGPVLEHYSLVGKIAVLKSDCVSTVVPTGAISFFVQPAALTINKIMVCTRLYWRTEIAKLDGHQLYMIKGGV